MKVDLEFELDEEELTAIANRRGKGSINEADARLYPRGRKQGAGGCKNRVQSRGERSFRKRGAVS
jgi:hypothetical protein